MFRKIVMLMIVLGLALSSYAMADEQASEIRIEKRVFVLDGEGEEDLTDIMALVEAEIGGDGDNQEDLAEVMELIESGAGESQDIELYVLKDETGEITIDKTLPGHERRIARLKRGMDKSCPMAHAGHHGRSMKMEALSEDAADCVLKNIKNAATDLAVKAVVNACGALNPID